MSVPLQTTTGEPVSPGAPKTNITPDLNVVPNAKSARPAPPTDPVKRAAFDMLDKHCARCHQTGALVGHAKPAKNFDNILNLDEIAANRKYVKPGDPDASLIYHVIIRQEMPYDVYQDADFDHPFPQAEDLQALRTWIKGLPEQRPGSDIVASAATGAPIGAPKIEPLKAEAPRPAGVAIAATTDATRTATAKIEAPRADGPVAAPSARDGAGIDAPAAKSGVTVVVGALPPQGGDGAPSLETNAAPAPAPPAPPVKTVLRSADPSTPVVVGHVPLEDKPRTGKNFEVASLEPESSTFATPAKKAAAAATPQDASAAAAQRALVLEAQQKLEQLGCFNGALSGIEDSETDQAITRFHDKLSRHDVAAVVTADLVGELEGQTFPICRVAPPAPTEVERRGERAAEPDEDTPRHERRAVKAPEHERKSRPEPRVTETHPAPPPSHKAREPIARPRYASREPSAPHHAARATPPAPRYSLREPRSAPVHQAAPSRSTAGDTISGINGI